MVIIERKQRGVLREKKIQTDHTGIVVCSESRGRPHSLAHKLPDSVLPRSQIDVIAHERPQPLDRRAYSGRHGGEVFI